VRALSTRLFLPVLGLALSCGGGNGGDPAPEVVPSVLGQGDSLRDLNDPANPRPPANEVLHLTGVRIKWIDDFDETNAGAVGNIFGQAISSEPVPYEGILVYKPAFSPPSFRVARGDVVDMTGQYQEFQPNVAFLLAERPGWTTPELTGSTVTLRFDAPIDPGKAAILPSYSELLDYDAGRKWLSMLVTLEPPQGLCVVTATVGTGRGQLTFYPNHTATDRPACEFTAEEATGIPAEEDIPYITNELFDLGKTDVVWKPGMLIKRVTGIVTLFDRFHIAPRFMADIELG
jgi:hypothetical protein